MIHVSTSVSKAFHISKRINRLIIFGTAWYAFRDVSTSQSLIEAELVSSAFDSNTLSPSRLLLTSLLPGIEPLLPCLLGVSQGSTILA